MLMKKSVSLSGFLWSTAVLFFTGFLAQPTAAGPKIKVEELLALHLQAIGLDAARNRVQNRLVEGPVTFVFRQGGMAKAIGDGTIVSEGPKLHILFRFPVQNYPKEDLLFDGTHTATGYLPGGQRSMLSLFLDTQFLPLRDGLLGGVLSTAWPLLHVDRSRPVLEYRGTKKMGGRPVHEMRYRSSQGSTDLKVTLYFDSESYRHVRTLYRMEAPTMMGSQGNYDLLIEDFSDFREIDGWTLPHQYRLEYSRISGQSSRIQEWTMTISKINPNQPTDNQTFTLR